MSMLYNAQFALPDGALILDIIGARAVAGRRVRPAQHAQPAGPFRGHQVTGFRRGTFEGQPIDMAVFLLISSCSARQARPGPSPGAAVYRGLRQRHVRDQLPARPGPPGHVCEQHPAVQLAAPVRPAAALAARRVGRAVPLRGPAAPVLRDHHGEPGPDPGFTGFGILSASPGAARLRAGDLPARAAPAGGRGHAAGSPGRSPPRPATRPPSSASSRRARTSRPPWPCRRRSPTRAS